MSHLLDDRNKLKVDICMRQNIVNENAVLPQHSHHFPWPLVKNIIRTNINIKFNEIHEMT